MALLTGHGILGGFMSLSEPEFPLHSLGNSPASFGGVGLWVSDDAHTALGDDL